MRLFQREEEESFVPDHAGPAFAKLGQWGRAAKVEAPDIVPVERLFQSRFITKEGAGIERLIAQEVIGTAPIFLAAALRDDIDQSAAVVAVLGRVVIAQDLDLADRVLIDRHADLVVAAWLGGIQAINRGDGGT